MSDLAYDHRSGVEVGVADQTPNEAIETVVRHAHALGV